MGYGGNSGKLGIRVASALESRIVNNETSLVSALRLSESQSLGSEFLVLTRSGLPSRVGAARDVLEVSPQ